MTVPAETPINTYVANGATSVFAYTFRIENQDEIAVYVDEVLQVSGYTVSGVGVNGGGAVTFAINPLNGSMVLLLREMPDTRVIDYQNSGDFRADTVNEDFDRLWLRVQQLQRDIDYRMLSFGLVESRNPSLNVLPSPQESKVLSWNASGQLENVNYSVSVTTQALVSVADVAQLRALTPSEFAVGAVVTVTDDGIAGQFKVVSGVATDDGVSIISSAAWASASKHWQRLDKPLIKGLVSNLAALKAIQLVFLNNNDIYATSGYAAVNDGGHGEYVWNSSSTATADDFKVIQVTATATGRFLLRPYGGRYNILQGGVTNDQVATATRVQAVFDALVDGDRLDWPAPTGTNFYNLDDTVELGDLDNIDMTGPGIEDLAVLGQVAPIKYTGSTVTGIENAVFRILGLSYSQVRNFMINVDNKADYGIWWSGANGGTMPGGITKSKRSTNCTFEESHAFLSNISGVVIGYSTGFSPQTDVLNTIRVRSSTTETGAAVDTTPVTRGFEILGLNTYVELLHCEATGDCGYYTSGNADFIGCYALNNDVAGWYNVSANTLCNLTKCYMEGLVGRPVQSTTDSQPTSRPWTVINTTAFPSGGTQYPCKFGNNQNVTMIGCMMDGWVTDNYASGHERPAYISLGNKWFTPVDYSGRVDITLIQNDIGAGVTQDAAQRYFHGLKRTFQNETAGPATLPEGASFHDVMVVSGAGGNTITLPSAIKGTSAIRVWRTGTGTTVAVPAAGDSIMRHDTGVAATASALLATAGQYGFMEFNCIQDGQWWVTSSLTVTYT